MLQWICSVDVNLYQYLKHFWASPKEFGGPENFIVETQIT